MADPNTANGAEANELDFTAIADIVTGGLKRRWPLIVASVAICLTAATAYWCTTASLYNATAQILVLQRGGKPLSDEGRSGRTIDMPEDYVPTQLMVLKSSRVIERAIATVGLNTLPTIYQKQLDLPTATRIVSERYLSVTRPDRNAAILRIDYRAGVRSEAIQMTEAIVNSYQTFLRDDLQHDPTEIVNLLTRVANELENELAKLENEYLALRRKNPLLAEGESGRSLVVRRLERWDDAAGSTRLKAASLRKQLELGRKLESSGTGLMPLAYALKQLGDNSSDQLLSAAAGNSQAFTSDYVRQLNQESQRVSEELGPEYSRARDLQEQISRTLESARESRQRVERADVEGMVKSIEESLASVEALERLYDQELEREKALAATFIGEQTSAIFVRTKMDRQRQFFTAVTEQLKRAQVSSEYTDVTMQIVEPPYALKAPVYPRKKLIFSVALFAGLAFGMGLAFITEGLCLRIRSHAELGRILGCPVIGRIPRLAPHQVLMSRDAALVTSALPRSQAAETYKEVQLHVERSHRERAAQVILVTGPTYGEGATATASNLAICLAGARRTVLMIDADLSAPLLHDIYEVRRDGGLLDVLRDEKPWLPLVQRTAIENLHVLTAGTEMVDAPQLLERPQLRDVIEEARKRYDYIIIDGPPLLASPEASIIAVCVDGVIAVVDRDRTPKGVAQRFAETIGSLGVCLLGVVANRNTSRESSFSPRFGQPNHTDADDSDGPLYLVEWNEIRAGRALEYRGVEQ